MYDYKCKYCGKEFNNIKGRSFSNHVRWCDKNTTNGDKGLKNIKQSSIKNIENRYGKKILIKRKCLYCGKEFLINNLREPILKKKIKNRTLKKCCSKKCAASYSQTFVKYDKKFKKTMSDAMKLKWSDPKYVKQMLSHPNIIRYFSSKGERELRDYFINNFPNDEWTYGGALKYNSVIISRDLYSKKLKICIEYDGIWHFKNICGQLAEKQLKDNALSEWCKENKYKLYRIKDEDFQKDKTKTIERLIKKIYK